MKAASTVAGIAQARVHLAPQPDDCKAQEQHAGLKVGDDALSLLKLERQGLDRANARVLRCYKLRDDQARALR